MRIQLNFVNDENTLFDLIKSKELFNNIVVTCPINIFGLMYCYTEQNSIIAVQGEIDYEVIYPIMDKEDAKNLYHMTWFCLSRLPFRNDEKIEYYLLSKCDICHKNDLLLRKLLTYDGIAYKINEIYIDSRTGKFYDILIEENNEFVYLLNSDKI